MLEETYIDPYIIANSIPEEDLIVNNQEEDSLSIKNIGNRFIDAIQTLSTSTDEKKDNRNNINLENINTTTETNTITKNVYIYCTFIENNYDHVFLRNYLSSRGIGMSKLE